MKFGSNQTFDRECKSITIWQVEIINAKIYSRLYIGNVISRWWCGGWQAFAPCGQTLTCRGGICGCEISQVDSVDWVRVRSDAPVVSELQDREREGIESMRADWQVTWLAPALRELCSCYILPHHFSCTSAMNYKIILESSFLIIKPR